MDMFDVSSHARIAALYLDPTTGTPMKTPPASH
jgi:hypothetical protein